MKLRSINNPIIIVGSYRGGTSLIAGAFYKCGAWIGTSMPPNRFNSKGYFENEGLKSLLHIMLQFSGYNDSDNLPPENLIDIRSPNRLDDLFERIIRTDDYHSGPITIKNPKILMFWRYFDVMFPKAKWVVVWRDPKEVLQSMQRVNALSVPPLKKQLNKQDLELVIKGYHSRLESICKKISPSRLKEINSSSVSRGDFTQLKTVIEWAGLQYNENAVKDFIDPSLFKRAI